MSINSKKESKMELNSRKGASPDDSQTRACDQNEKKADEDVPRENPIESQTTRGDEDRADYHTRAENNDDTGGSDGVRDSIAREKSGNASRTTVVAGVPNPLAEGRAKSNAETRVARDGITADSEPGGMRNRDDASSTGMSHSKDVDDASSTGMSHSKDVEMADAATTDPNTTVDGHESQQIIEN